MHGTGGREWEPTWTAENGWAVDFRVAGRRIRRRLGLRSKGERSLARAQAERIWREAWERHLDPVAPPSSPRFYAAARDYVADGGDARFLPRLIEHFGADTRCDDIDEARIVAAALALYPGRAPDTHRRQVRVPINAILRHARGERRRPSTDRKRTRWLTPEEAERLLTAAAELTPPRHGAPERATLAKIAMLLGTGIRTGELFALDVDQINVATRQAWIAAEVEGAGKTAGATRWVRIPDRAWSLIAPLPDDGRFARTPYGKPYKMRAKGGGQMKAAFDAARALAGLGDDVTPHVLRHTWATWYYAQTRDFGGLMDLGGWAKADMANRYRKLAPDDLADRLLAHGWSFGQDMDNRRRRDNIRVINQ